MRHEIDYVEHVDPDDDLVHWIELEIDDQVFILDKGDVWNLFCISKSVFDRMIDPPVVVLPPVNREIVMKEE